MTESLEIQLVAVAFGLFLLPRILERWFIPSAITAFGLGLLYRYLDLSLQGDTTISFLAILGISSLFLLAGLEVDFNEMRRVARVLMAHLTIRLGVVVLVAVPCRLFLELSVPAAGLMAIALLTPSAGFILDSLASLPLREEQRFWVKMKAIASELLAILIMFFCMQSGSVNDLMISAGGVLLILAVLPALFVFFAKFVAPHAKGSEFSFFVLLSVVVGIATKKLGMYYLVGAFIVGITVQRFESYFPVMNLKKIEMALKLFCSFFIPFYFFRSGGGVAVESFSMEAFKIAAILLGAVLPIRVFAIVLHRKRQFNESWRESLPIALALTPTLVFGLVVSGILKANFGISDGIYGGLLIYTIGATILPGFLLRNSSFQDVPEPFESLQMLTSKVH